MNVPSVRAAPHSQPPSSIARSRELFIALFFTRPPPAKTLVYISRSEDRVTFYAQRRALAPAGNGQFFNIFMTSPVNWLGGAQIMGENGMQIAFKYTIN